MSIQDLLIATRGEIAVRIARSASTLGIRAHAVYSRDDTRGDHAVKANAAYALEGEGPLPT